MHALGEGGIRGEEGIEKVQSAPGSELRSDFHDSLAARIWDSSHSPEDLCLVQFEWPVTALQSQRQDFHASPGSCSQMGSMGLALALLSPRGRAPVTSPNNSASLRTRASGGPSELLPHNCNTVLGANLNVGSRQRDL